MRPFESDCYRRPAGCVDAFCGEAYVWALSGVWEHRWKAKVMNRAPWVAVCWMTIACPVFGQSPEKVRFTTSDGVNIMADYVAPKDRAAPVVILLHMYRSDRTAWRPLIPKLHEAGLAVLALDMRGHGESVEPASMKLAKRAADRDEALFQQMYEDVKAGYAFLAQRPEVDLTRFALIGASVGGSVALDYAGRDPSVDVVICLSPGERYLGVDSIRDIRRLGERPILLMATEGERAAPEALSRINKSATVRIVGPGAVHGTKMFGEVKGVESEIMEFLRKHVGASEETPVVAAFGGGSYFAVGSQEHMELPRGDVRWFSSTAEARARGLTGPESPVHGRVGDFPAADHDGDKPPP